MAIKQPVVLPPNRQWSQQNTGFIFGSVYSSRNLNFEVPGVVSLSRRMKVMYREATSGSDFDLVQAIVYGEFGATASGFSSTDQYVAVTSDDMFLISGDLTNVGVLTNASTPTGSGTSDGISWNDGLYVTTVNNLSKLVSGTWTGSLMSLSGSSPSNLVPHPLERSASANYLLVGNGNKVEKRTTAGVNSTALTFPENYQVVWIRSDYSRTLIGARTKDGTNGAVFEWDEVAPTWTNKYDLDFSWPYSGCFRNTDFFVVSNDGRLMKFNGGGFSEAAEWPIYKAQPGYWDSSGVGTAQPVYQRSMNVIRGHVKINVNAQVTDAQYGGPLYENFPGGVWTFDESTGLTHEFGLVSSTNDTDYAQMLYQLGSGAIAPVVLESSPPDSADGSLFMTGARLTEDGVTNYHVLVTVVSGGLNVGQLTTTRIETTDIADDAKKLWVKYRGVFTADDLIRFKYKDQWLNGLPFSTASPVSWTSSTVFTSTDANFANVVAGHEVTVMDGSGAGSMRHVSSISEAAGTYTVTLDEAVPNVAASDESTVGVDNFKLLETTITMADTDGYKGIPLDQTDPRTWVQAKAELRGTEYVTIEEVQLVPASDVLAQP